MCTFKRPVQLDPVFLDKVAVVFPKPQFSVTGQISWLLLCLLDWFRWLYIVSHTITLVNRFNCYILKAHCKHIQTEAVPTDKKNASYIYIFLWLRLTFLRQTQVCEPVLAVIPPSKCQVNSSYKGYCLVNGHHLFMVSPEEHHRGHMVRMPHYLTNRRGKSDIKM